MLLSWTNIKLYKFKYSYGRIVLFTFLLSFEYTNSALSSNVRILYWLWLHWHVTSKCVPKICHIYACVTGMLPNFLKTFREMLFCDFFYNISVYLLWISIDTTSRRIWKIDSCQTSCQGRYLRSLVYALFGFAMSLKQSLKISSLILIT